MQEFLLCALILPIVILMWGTLFAAGWVLVDAIREGIRDR